MEKKNLIAFLIFVIGATAYSVDFKPIIIDPSYLHTKYAPLADAEDVVYRFRAYVTCFDLGDDDNGDGSGDLWGIPHWISYEIKRFPDTLGPGPKRPRPWITVRNFYDSGLMPGDESYLFPNAWRAANPNSPQLGYDRGHMCPKFHAWRLGAEADWNTHTVMNACPQKKDLNQGIWLDLEERIARWADTYERIWVMTGPIIYNRTPTRWLGQEDEFLVAIPDAFYKIVIKETATGPEALAFIYPQLGILYRRSGEHDHRPYLTSIDMIEALTWLDFCSNLDDEVEQELENKIHIKLWD